MILEIVSVGDVVFKLSFRRKRKYGDNKERKWFGLVYLVSFVWFFYFLFGFYRGS